MKTDGKDIKMENTDSERKSRNSKSSREGRTKATVKGILIGILLLVVALVLSVFIALSTLFWGPSKSARNLAVKTLDETSAMKWVPYLFLPKSEVYSILGKDKVPETDVTPDDSEEPFIYDFGDSKDITYDVTLDLGYSLELVLKEDLTVKSCKLSDALEGISPDNYGGRNFSEVSLAFISALSRKGIIIPGENDALLIGTVSKSADISEKIGTEIEKVIKENEFPITVLSLYSVKKDAGISGSAAKLGMSYNRVRLCNLIANGNSSVFYSLSFMNLSEIVNYCRDKSIDLSSLVDSANIKEQEKQPVETEVPAEDEWKDCPDGIKIIRITGKTYNATLLLIKDPARVYATTSLEYRGIKEFSPKVAGASLFTITKREKAVASINGGFFYDGNYTYKGETLYNGSMPFGSVVSKGQFLYENSGGPYKGFIGFTNDNVLVAFKKSITKEEYEKYGIRDGMACCPALIIGGEPQSYAGAEEENGLNPRSAIGQRADGAVIFLTIDGRQGNSLGGTYSDIIDIMLEYGAVTAGNLDGGSSSAMYYLDSRGIYGTPGEYVEMNSRAQITQLPRNIPTFFMVRPEV